MIDLPIKTASNSATPTANKPSNNSDASTQGTQDFGNVLARQVADKNQATEPTTNTAEVKQPANEQISSEKITTDSSNSALPADIMVALLAQQNQTSAAQPEILAQQNIPATPGANIQALVEGKPVALASAKTDKESVAAALAGKGALLSPAPLGGKANPALSAKPEIEATLPHINIAAHTGTGFADSLKSTVMKDINAVGNIATTARGSDVIGDLTTAMQQPSILPLEAAAAAPSSQNSINTALNQPAWGDDFSQKITWMATQRNQSAELHLNPPQLGPLDVVLKMNGDQASAVFTSPHAAVREAIEQAIPRLREMLADSGITLGNAMVSDHSAQQNQDNSARKSQDGLSASAGVTEETNVQEVRVSPIKRHNGMVDTFA